MASHSNLEPSLGRENSTKGKNLTLSECTCPICMYIFIEPVTMPCKHELCMMCFQKNVQEASLSCPLCRKRISTWARRATKLGKVINEKRWAAIKEAFPRKVQRRIEGLEGVDSEEEEEEYIHVPNIAAPGEIRGEYEREMEKVEAERRRLQLEEEEASRVLIEQLQAEETERRRQQEHLMQQDEELVRKLMENASPVSNRGTPKSTMLDRFVTRSKSQSSNSSSTSSYLTIRQPESNQSSAAGPSRPSSIGSAHKIYTPFPNKSGGQKNIASFTAEDSNLSTLSTDLNISPAANTSRSTSENQSEVSFGSDARIQPVDPSVNLQRPGSADSMSQELCHFKPIHCSPCTPPRHVVEGRYVNPPIIRSTPRNLSQMSSSEDQEDVGSIPVGSPVMRRRLSELEEERKEKVAAMSKSTGTELPPLPVMREDSSSPSLLSNHLQQYEDVNFARKTAADRATRSLSFDDSLCSSGGFGTAGSRPTEKVVFSPLAPVREPKDAKISNIFKPDALPLENQPDSSSTEERFGLWLHTKRKKGEEKFVKSSAKKTVVNKASDANCNSLADSYPKPVDRKSQQISQQSSLENRSLVRDTHVLGNKDSSQSSSFKRRNISSEVNVCSREDSATSPSNHQMSCSMNAATKSSQSEVTASLLTPGSLTAKKEPIHMGKYGQDMPQLLEKARDKVSKINHLKSVPKEPKTVANIKTSSESQTDARRGTMTSPTQKVMGSVKKCWEMLTVPLRSQSVSGDPDPQTEQLVGLGIHKSSSLSDLKGSVRTVSQQTKLNLQKPGGDTPTNESTNKGAVSTLTKSSWISQKGDSDDFCDGKPKNIPAIPPKVQTPKKKNRSPQKQLTPTRRSNRQRVNASQNGPVKKDIEIKDSAKVRVDSEKDNCNISREDCAGVQISKASLKRVHSTEDKENEESSDSMSDTPAKRSRKISHEDEECSEDEVFNSPKKQTNRTHFAIEYSPGEDGKRLIKFTKPRAVTTKGRGRGRPTKQATLCFVSSADASTSGTQKKLGFTSESSGSGRSVSASSSRSKSSPRRHVTHVIELDSSDDEAESKPQLPVPKFLDRSCFNTEEEYRQHVEEQDMLLAQQLQEDFNLEQKLRLTAIRRKGSDGQYELRRRGQSRACKKD